MKNEKKIILAFKERIGEGKQFATENALAQYLGLGNTQHTKLYDFLKGSDTRYKSVCHWLDLMGWTIHTGNLSDTECYPEDVTKLQAENAALREEVADLKSQLKFAEKILRPEPQKKAPAQEDSRKDAKFYRSSGTEGE